MYKNQGYLLRVMVLLNPMLLIHIQDH